MHEELVPDRRHPAALASIVIAGVAVTALALVTIAYLLGWVPMRNVSSPPGSMAMPGQQVTGTVQQGELDLLPGETLVAPAEIVKPAPSAAPSPQPTPMPATPMPSTPRYARPAPFESPKPSVAPKKPSPAYAQPSAPSSSTSYAQVRPSRAAPLKPTYDLADAPLTSFERSTRNICVNCGTISSIGSSGGEWEVRVRFEDGSYETLRYPNRPRLRIGERVHLEDGRLIAE